MEAAQGEADHVELENKFSSLEVSESQEDHIQSSQDEALLILQDAEENLTHEVKNLKDNLEKLDNVQNDHTTSLEFTQAQVADLQKENKNLLQYLDDIELEVRRNTYAMEKLESKQIDLETSLKKCNLVVEGLSEAPRGAEDTHATVKSLFEALQLDHQTDYDQAYCLGPYRDNKTRALFISFSKLSARNYVYSQRSTLKESPHHFNVWINDDVTPEARRVRNVVRQVTREVKSAGARCTNAQQAVIINGKRFDLNNFDALPEDFSLESLKTKKVNDSDLAYHSEHLPFSNLYPCSIMVGKVEFQSVEQVLQYKKAKLLNNHREMQAILLSRDPYEIRQKGAELGKSKEWDDKAEEVMYAAMIRKFGNSKALLAKLLSTGNLRLVEATPDRKWGAGVSLTSKSIKTGKWPGENRQGILLMKVRDRLRAENKAKVTKQVARKRNRWRLPDWATERGDPT